MNTDKAATSVMGKHSAWKSRPVRLGLAQFSMVDDMEANLKRALDTISEAASQGAQLVCLPELFRTPYFCTVERCSKDYTEPNLPDLIARLSKHARENRVVLVAGSIYENDSVSGRKYNTALVFDSDGRHLGNYRKTHIPHDPAFYEMNYFAPGDTGFQVFETAVGRVSPLICYDQWFPEAARACALAGAEIIVYPTAIAQVASVEQVEGPWQSAWEGVQRGHAIANNVVVAGVNRVGTEGESSFWGGSFVYDGFGGLVAHAGSSEEVLIANVDLGHSEFSKQSWRFFESRRPGCYRALTDSAS